MQFFKMTSTDRAVPFGAPDAQGFLNFVVFTINQNFNFNLATQVPCLLKCSIVRETVTMLNQVFRTYSCAAFSFIFLYS
jgi:hypothetical protein